MTTLSDLKEVKEALDAGLVSQAEYDDVKSNYLSAKKEALEANREFQKKELRAREEALEFQKKSISECQKMELRARMEACEANREFQKRELIAKEALHKKELHTREEALWANREFLKRELIAKVAFHKKELHAKKEAIEANKEFQKQELLAKEEFQQKRSEADLRAFALESIVKHGSSLMSEEQKADLVRDYAKMSGLDGSAEKYARASKRQRVSAEKRDASPPQPPTPPRTSLAPAAAAVPPPTDAPAPVVTNQARVLASRRSKRFRSMSALVMEAAAAASEDGNYSDDDGEDDSDSVEPRTGKRCYKHWTVEDDAALVAALRAGQKANTIRIGGRPAGAGQAHLSWAKANGLCTPALREYLEETCPEYVYKPSRVCPPWSEEEDQTFIQAHKEGKMIKEIAAMLPGRTENAVHTRLSDAKRGKAGSAALRAYVAECAPEIRSPWSVEEDQIFIQAHKKGKIFQEITAMLPGRTECAVEHRWSDAKKGKAGTAALRAYAAEYRKNK